MFSKILSTGSYLPQHIRTNADLEKMVDTSDEWIVTRSGIRERRIAAPDETVSTMGFEAAQKAIEAANINPQEIDLILVATTSNSHAYPSAACQIQGMLEIDDAIAFDLAAACTGFVYALGVADQFIRTGKVKKALVIGSDLNSRKLDETDRSTVVLFGDGAGAAVVSEVPEGYGLKGVDLGADGTGGSALCIPAGGTAVLANDQRIEEGLTFIHMDGPEVYKFAVKTMGKTALKSLERANMNLDELDYFIPHQANIRIIDSAAKRLHMPKEKVFVNLHKYGNTSAASVAIALDEANREGCLKRGDNVALAGFGAGLTWASLVLKWY